MSIICCPPKLDQVAQMDMIIGVGLGCATVKKGDELVYCEPTNPNGWEDFWTVQDAENEARKDPDHDWIIDMQGPLRGKTYKRMGEDNWVLIDSNRGIA
jgi:hypothetical protein